VLDDEQARVDNKEDVLPGLGALVTRFREKVGENPATLRQHDMPLAEATTSSIDALKAYSAGLKAQFTSGARRRCRFSKGRCNWIQSLRWRIRIWAASTRIWMKASWRRRASGARGNSADGRANARGWESPSGTKRW
jgi:hypothetical protein